MSGPIPSATTSYQSSTSSEKDLAGTGEGEKTLPGSEPPTSNQLPILGHAIQETHHVEQIPWRYKLAAGSMIILFAFGSSLSESTFGPLKSTLVEELGITSESGIPQLR
jgi:hypothetical protein